jgi:ankyrin repeat protein
LLLKAGADPNHTVVTSDQCRFTLLTGVVGEGERGVENAPPHERAPELAELLLEHGANPNDGQALYNTQFTEDDRWLKLLLARGLRQGDRVNWIPDGPTTLDYQLCQAVHWGFSNRVSLLLSHGADPNASSVYSQRSTYALASRRGRTDIAHMLADAGADTALDEEDQLWVLLHGPGMEAARAWLQSHPELLKRADTFVQLAEDGHEAGVTLMLDEGTEPDIENRNQRTALHVACMNDHRNLVRLLLSRGASLDKPDGMYGGTAIGWAQTHGKHEFCAELKSSREKN